MDKRKKPHSKEHNRKIGLANSVLMKGKHNSPKTEFKKGQVREKSYSWKGEKAGYVSRHIWLKKNIGKASKCETKVANQG